MAESLRGMDTAGSLFHKHFEFITAEDADTHDWVGASGPIDWNELLKDLRRCPKLAKVRGGISALPPLHYVVLLEDPPLRVIDKLLEIHPNAVDARERDHGWNIIQWMTQWANRPDISPQVLRRILEHQPDFATEEYDSNESPIEFFIHHDPNSRQVKAILDTCPNAIPFILGKHKDNKVVLPDGLLTSLEVKAGLASPKKRKKGRGGASQKATGSKKKRNDDKK